MLDIAYRTGKTDDKRVRSVFVKVVKIEDRNIVMREGKTKERANEMEGVFSRMTTHKKTSPSKKDVTAS